MIDEICRLWWLFSIRSLLALTFAYICYLLSSSMATLALRPAGFVSMQIIFSFYIVASGFVMLTGGLYAYDTGMKHWPLLLINGLAGIGLGIALFATLALSLPAIFTLFGVHALAGGCFYLAIAARMRQQRGSALLLGATSIFSAGFGTFFIIQRNMETIHMTSSMALFSVVLGLLMLAFSISLRQAHVRELSGAPVS